MTKEELDRELVNGAESQIIDDTYIIIEDCCSIVSDGETVSVADFEGKSGVVSIANILVAQKAALEFQA